MTPCHRGRSRFLVSSACFALCFACFFLSFCPTPSLRGPRPPRYAAFPAASSCLQHVRCCHLLTAACSLPSLLPAFIHVLPASCQLSLLASFHFLSPLSIPFFCPCFCPHPLARKSPSLSRGETYWLRHSNKPRAYPACTPARFQMYHTLRYMPPLPSRLC